MTCTVTSNKFTVKIQSVVAGMITGLILVFYPLLKKSKRDAMCANLIHTGYAFFNRAYEAFVPLFTDLDRLAG